MKLLTTSTASILLLGASQFCALGAVFTDLDAGNSDWSTAGNWDVGEPLATDDVFIFDSLTADLTMALEVGRVIHVGDARAGGTTPVGTLNMTGGDLTVTGIKLGSDSDGAVNAIGAVDGTFAFTDGTISLNSMDQSLANGIEIGSATVDGSLDGITAATGAMTMGDGTSSPTLNYTQAHIEVGWGAGSTATFDFKSGTITGTDTDFDPNLVLGQVIGSTGTATMTVGGFPTAAAFTTDTNINHNGGNATLTIDSNGSVTCNNLQFSNDPASTTSSVVVKSTSGSLNPPGSLTVNNNLADRDGLSSLTIDGGTVNLTSTTSGNRGVEELVLGGSGAGSTISLPVGSTPLNVLVGAATSVEGAGTHNIQADSIASVNTAALIDIWTGSTGTWANGDGTTWNTGIAPDGGVGIGDHVPVIFSAATIPGASTASFAVTGTEFANFSGVSVLTGFNPDDIIALTAAAAFDIGALRAVIDDPLSIVDRGSDLRVARDTTADAQQLNISDGSLTLTAGELIIGGVQNNDPPIDVDPIFVDGVANNGSLVLQTGGTVTVETLRFFDSTVLPLGDLNDVPMGGIYNLDGGTLTVTGDIIEGPGVGDDSVNQGRIDVDGGTLDFQGTNITVESFRIGQDAGSTGSFTLESGETLTTTGGFFMLGNNGTGTFTAETGSTLNVLFDGAAATRFQMAENEEGDATFISNGAEINSEVHVRIADRGVGRMELNGDTVFNTTVNEFKVSDGDRVGDANATGEFYGGDGTLVMNDNASITVGDGKHFEMAELSTQGRTVVRPVKGTLEMNDSASILVDGGSFFLGRNDHHEVLVTMTGGTIEVLTDIQSNASRATVNISGGVMRATRWRASNAAGAISNINVSGTGFIDLSGEFQARNNGMDHLVFSDEATVLMASNFRLDYGADFGFRNELDIVGSDVVFDVTGNYRANASSQVNFIPSATGVSTVVAGGALITGSILEFDDSVAAPTSANDLGDLMLFQLTAAAVGTFGGLAEGATVKAYGDGTEYQITYLGGDGNDIVLLAVESVADTDGDGMTDDYEDANGLDKADPNDGSSDLDGDGFEALFEFVMGTLAGDASSVPIWTIEYVSATEVNLTYGPITTGTNYVLGASADGESFLVIDDFTAAADGATNTVTDTSGDLDVELYQLTATLP